MEDKKLSPSAIKKLGLEWRCVKCEEFKQKHGSFKAGFMCPVCGVHIDEFGNNNNFKAVRFIVQAFRDQGLRIPDIHAESLYQLARLKSREGEATYLDTVHFAINLMKSGNKLPNT